MKPRFAGRSSQTPTWLTALTAKVWRPKESFLSRFGERIFYELQKLEGERKRLSRFIDRINTRWLRMESRVESGAFEIKLLFD